MLQRIYIIFKCYCINCWVIVYVKIFLIKLFLNLEISLLQEKNQICMLLSLFSTVLYKLAWLVGLTGIKDFCVVTEI